MLGWAITVISALMYWLKRLYESGPTVWEMEHTAESGTISPFSLRTIWLRMSSAVRRSCVAPCIITLKLKPLRVKSLI